MRSMAFAACAFAAMEPITAATHRFVMHGIGFRLHRSHHRLRRLGAFEANDAFPVLFAAVVGVGLWIGFHDPGRDELIPVGGGVTAYGMAYAMVHDVYIHGRVRAFAGRRWALLDRLAAAHAVHHRTSGAPYGMLVPVVPRSARVAAVAMSPSGSRPSHVPADA